MTISEDIKREQEMLQNIQSHLWFTYLETPHYLQCTRLALKNRMDNLEARITALHEQYINQLAIERQIQETRSQNSKQA